MASSAHAYYSASRVHAITRHRRDASPPADSRSSRSSGVRAHHTLYMCELLQHSARRATASRTPARHAILPHIHTCPPLARRAQREGVYHHHHRIIIIIHRGHPSVAPATYARGPRLRARRQLPIHWRRVRLAGTLRALSPGRRRLIQRYMAWRRPLHPPESATLTAGCGTSARCACAAMAWAAPHGGLHAPPPSTPLTRAPRRCRAGSTCSS